MKLSVGKRTRNSICFPSFKTVPVHMDMHGLFFLFICDNWRKNPRTPKFYKKNIEKRVLKNIFQKNTFLQSYNPTNYNIFQTNYIYIYLYINNLHSFLVFSLLFLAVGICRNL